MSIIEAIVLGLVQGLTEFIPISSTAHLEIVPVLLGWGDPGAAASAVIQWHVGTIVAAALVGLVLMTGLKGTTFHRVGGYIYMAAMFLTGVVTLFIPRPQYGPHLGPFGPLHIFSLTALIGVPAALYFARKGKWMIHGRIMGGLFVGGIGIAGIGAFTPGRIMYQVFFG